MLLAYRRGLLEPYYSNGVQSYARENMVLRMLDSELVADSIEKSVNASATAISSHVDPKFIKEYAHSNDRLLAFAADKREYSARKFESSQDATLSQSAQLIKAFKDAKKHGILDAFAKRCEEHNNKLRSEL